MASPLKNHEREEKILKLLLQGMAQKDICQMLSLNAGIVSRVANKEANSQREREASRRVWLRQQVAIVDLDENRSKLFYRRGY